MWKCVTLDRCIIDIIKHSLKVDFETMLENHYVSVMSHKNKKGDNFRGN